MDLADSITNNSSTASHGGYDNKVKEVAAAVVVVNSEINLESRIDDNKKKQNNNKEEDGKNHGGDATASGLSGKDASVSGTERASSFDEFHRSNGTATPTIDENDIESEIFNDDEKIKANDRKRLRERRIRKINLQDVTDDEESDASEALSEHDDHRKKRSDDGNSNSNSNGKRRKYIPCVRPKCNNRARGRDGLCIRHGGGPRCLYEGCTSGARDSSQLCMHHGGGARCSHHSGCTKGAVGGVYCIRHGGGKRCLFDGCDKSSFRHYGYCSNHMKLIKTGKTEINKSNETDDEKNLDEKESNYLKEGDAVVVTKNEVLNKTVANVTKKNTRSLLSSNVDVDQINNTVESKSGNTATLKERPTESQIKSSKKSRKNNTLPVVYNSESATMSSLIHPGVDPRMHVSPYNIPLVPLPIHQGMGMSYPPYPIYGVPYFNPPHPIMTSAMTIHPQIPFGYIPAHDAYRPPP